MALAFGHGDLGQNRPREPVVDLSWPVETEAEEDAGNVADGEDDDEDDDLA